MSARIDVHVGAADAERVHFAVEFGQQLTIFLLIAVRADALDLELFPEKIGVDFFVALGRPQTDADNTLHDRFLNNLPVRGDLIRLAHALLCRL